MYYYLIYSSSLSNYQESKKKYLTTALYGSILYILTHAYFSSSNSNFIKSVKDYFWVILAMDILTMLYLYTQNEGTGDIFQTVDQLKGKINKYLETEETDEYANKIGHYKNSSLYKKENTQLEENIENDGVDNQQQEEENGGDFSSNEIDEAETEKMIMNSLKNRKTKNKSKKTKKELDKTHKNPNENTDNLNKMLQDLQSPVEEPSFNNLSYKPDIPNTKSTSLAELRQQRQNNPNIPNNPNVSKHQMNQDKMDNDLANFVDDSASESGSEVEFDMEDFEGSL